ncbi:hypothetical protein EVAR_101311_1 [Eumeta japonica]|uniref:Uncharacterized protein n=1 Tax=Eumeta variegata TaxID=151549 RepID=A0A4C2AEC9_EUMVA|nr:hypothetical protein EVAR_101311_1 [Eumeta japonica]
MTRTKHSSDFPLTDKTRKPQEAGRDRGREQFHYKYHWPPKSFSVLLKPLDLIHRGSILCNSVILLGGKFRTKYVRGPAPPPVGPRHPPQFARRQPLARCYTKANSILRQRNDIFVLSVQF